MLLQLHHYGEFIVTFEEISHLFLRSVPLTMAKYSTLFLISFEFSEAVARRCSVKKVLLKISQDSQENTCAGVSYLRSPSEEVPLNLLKSVGFVSYQ